MVIAMKMYENIPPLPDMLIHQTPESVTEDCEKIVEWAESNLPIVNKAEGMKHYYHLTENQKLTIALAYLIHENVYQINRLIEQEMYKPIFVKLP